MNRGYLQRMQDEARSEIDFSTPPVAVHRAPHARTN
jgi:hypothetical protein